MKALMILPEREYEFINICGVRFATRADVWTDKDGNYHVYYFNTIDLVDDDCRSSAMPDALLDSRAAQSNETWRELIAQEIIAQAEKIDEWEDQ